jgi:hypothetical protein
MAFPEKKDWFKLKPYSHIGLGFKYHDRQWINGYVKDPSKISNHSFLPFLHRKITVRKFRRPVLDDGSRSKLRIAKSKTRHIFYAGHLDSQVYSYYAKLLSAAFEKRVGESGLQDCVTAYRRIKISKGSSGRLRNKCNVDFANDVFTFIKNQAPTNLVAVTFDIKGFFDSLDHSLLKLAWRNVIGSKNDLPADHYKIFRNISKFSYVEENELFDFFKDSIIVKRSPNLLRKKNIAKISYLRNQRAVAYCFENEIDSIRSAGLINANRYFIDADGVRKRRSRGIPQGSPISAVLANIYMFNFDTIVSQYLKSIGGLYRRYSDDMIVVCDIEMEGKVINFFLDTIAQFKLEIQSEKTQVFHFIYSLTKSRYANFEKNSKTGSLMTTANFEYLGFQFDGFYTLLKNSSLSGYYRKMKRSFARGIYYSRHNRTTTKGELFKNRLYKKFTHVGASRRRIYKRRKGFTGQFVIW